jgi:hypothetical protein
MKENQMSEFQNKLDETFGKAENFEDVLKQGVKDATAPGPGEAQKAEEPIKPEQPVTEEVELPVVEAAAVEPPKTEQEVADEAEVEAKAAAEKEEKDKGHRDIPAEKRIAKVVKEREEARLERDRLKGELETLRQARQVETPGSPRVDPDAPNPANYPEGEKDVDFKVDVKLYQRDQEQRGKAFQSHLQELVAKHPDAKEFLEMDVQRNRSGIATANAVVAKLIQESENPIELRYYLLSNSDEAIRIARLDPFQTAKAIGRIEAKLEAPELVPDSEPEKPRKPLPAPINPVKPTKPNAVVGNKHFGFTEY